MKKYITTMILSLLYFDIQGSSLGWKALFIAMNKISRDLKKKKIEKQAELSERMSYIEHHFDQHDA